MNNLKVYTVTTSDTIGNTYTWDVLSNDEEINLPSYRLLRGDMPSNNQGEALDEALVNSRFDNVTSLEESDYNESDFDDE